MKLPALPQTIRAIVLRNCSRKKEDGTWEPGLWVHCPDPGKRTGPYKLLPAGFAADAEVDDDEDEDENEEEESEEM